MSTIAPSETDANIRLRQLIKSWGPAWLVMIADVDAASVITAAETGAQHTTHLLWFLLLLAVPLYFIQEVAGRVGAVTGMGLGELIRERFSRRVAIVAAVPMAVVDVVSYVVEYTGVAIGFQMFGVPAVISVPLVFVVHLILVYRRKYEQAERPLLILTIFFVLAWVAAAALSARRGVTLVAFYFSPSPRFLFLLAANVGAVIMPFMLFYQASATAEKRITHRGLWSMRLETAIGAGVSELIMVAIAIAAARVKSDSLTFAAPRELARGLASVAGALAPYVFGIGLIAASLIALVVISLGSSWGFTEAVGWGRKNWFKVYVAESVPALVVPIVSLNLINVALGLMVLQIVVLIGPAVTLGVVASNRGLMAQHALRGVNRIIYWAFLVLIVGTGALSLAVVG